MTDNRSKIITILKKVPLFNGMYEDEYITLSSLFVAKETPEGRVVFREGDASLCMYVMLSGEIALTTIEAGHIYTLHPGEIFGEIGLLSQNPRTATATCLRKCVMMEITREDYNILMSKFPHLSNIIMRNIALNLSRHIVRMNKQDVVSDIKKVEHRREVSYTPRKDPEPKESPTVIKLR